MCVSSVAWQSISNQAHVGSRYGSLTEKGMRKRGRGPLPGTAMKPACRGGHLQMLVLSSSCVGAERRSDARLLLKSG
jgi:hypothetical protein